MHPISMDPARWANILQLDREYAAGQAMLSARPLEAYIEVAARCNLRCQMCPIIVDPRYQSGSGFPALLSEEMFDRLAPVFPTLKRAYLFGLGEPILHPRLVDFTERLARAGVEVWITTNATLIDQEKADALARAGLTRVSVSIDGGTPQTYERIRQRGKWEDVVRGLKALGEARRRYGRPLVYLNVVAMSSNLKELTQLVELCADCGGDGVFVEGLYPYQHPVIEAFVEKEHVGHLGREKAEELFEAARQRAAELGIDWSTRLEEQALNAPKAGPAPLAAEPEPSPDVPTEERLSLPWACSEPFVTLNINAAGEVRPCCFNDSVLGRLSENTIEEIWNGPGYAGLRGDMIAGRVPDTCATCVREGRVKCNSYILPRHGEVAHPGNGAAPEVVLDMPADGELVAGPLIVVGRAPRSSWLAPKRPLDLARLPQVFLDQNRMASLADYAAIDGDQFVAVMPVDFVSEGAHLLSLRPPGGREEQGWGHRWLQIGPLAGGDVAGVSRVAVAVTIQNPERRPPRLRIDGRRHGIDRWVCGEHGGAWLGAAVISVDRLAIGSHDVELIFERNPVYRTLLERLPAPA